MEWILDRLVAGWDAAQAVAAWADEHVLAAVFFGFLVREIVRFIVKRTPTPYDDLGFEMIEDALKVAWARVEALRKRR